MVPYFSKISFSDWNGGLLGGDMYEGFEYWELPIGRSAKPCFRSVSVSLFEFKGCLSLPSCRPYKTAFPLGL